MNSVKSTLGLQQLMKKIRNGEKITLISLEQKDSDIENIIGRCTTRRFKIPTATELSYCNSTANWRHPRYPEGLFCDHCRKKLLSFFPDDWKHI